MIWDAGCTLWFSWKICPWSNKFDDDPEKKSLRTVGGSKHPNVCDPSGPVQLISPSLRNSSVVDIPRHRIRNSLVWFSGINGQTAGWRCFFSEKLETFVRKSEMKRLSTINSKPTNKYMHIVSISYYMCIVSSSEKLSCSNSVMSIIPIMPEASSMDHKD